MGRIGFIGVVIALLLVFGIRACSMNDNQDDINEFCIDIGYEYGSEIGRNTAIECRSWDGSDSYVFKYSEFRDWRDGNESERTLIVKGGGDNDTSRLVHR